MAHSLRPCADAHGRRGDRPVMSVGPWLPSVCSGILADRWKPFT